MLSAQHSGKAQEMARLGRALDLVAEGLRDLDAMGHHYHLAEGDGPQVPEYPKVLFHATSAPNGRLVRSEFEDRALGVGWFETLEEAQHWDGHHHSMRGRGGLTRGGLPMRLDDFEPVEARLARKAELWHEARLREPSLKKRVFNGRGGDGSSPEKEE